MPLRRHWTPADVRAITHEDRPLIDGELLVTPAPRGPHQLAAFEIAMLLNPYLER